MDDATTVDTNPLSSPAPSWCSNSTFVQFLRDAQTRLWTSINGAREREDFIDIIIKFFLTLSLRGIFRNLLGGMVVRVQQLDEHI